MILVGQNDLNLAFEFKSRFHSHRPKSKRIGSTYEIFQQCLGREYVSYLEGIAIAARNYCRASDQTHVSKISVSWTLHAQSPIY